ncbi:SPARC-like protein 1 [Nematolebias whitei]|uniref:SPARC-like protein 1 n=1 Tax=Nematolebias whitei TaxID=451745 RepID=UPI0018977CCD|nr:SPARC-like protein 1 [Nematolebias whitei]
MRACLSFIFFLGTTFVLSVKSTSHGKQHELQKTTHTTKEKDLITEEANKPQVFPTLFPYESSSLGQEDEEMSSEDNSNTKKDDEEVTKKKMGSTAVLLSEEELVDLLEKEAKEEEEAEEREAAGATEDEETFREDKMLADSLEAEKDHMEKRDDVKKEEEEEEIMKVSLDQKVEKAAGMMTTRTEQVGLLEEAEGSTDSELPVDLDYAADGQILHPLQAESAIVNLTAQDLPGVKKEEDNEEEQLSPNDGNDPDTQSSEAGVHEEMSHQHQESSLKSEEINISKRKTEAHEDRQELKSSTTLTAASHMSEKEEEKSKNESEAPTERKTRRLKKNQRSKKHSPQRNETLPAQEQNQQEPQELEVSSTESPGLKTKKRRAGKWGPLVGVNPVQIRASVDLYPKTSFGRDERLTKTPTDPCDSFRCKRGKTCKLAADGKPECACQQPSECRPSINEFDHVCGTDNKTYDTSCELFATKCNLEGTKRGHKLHLDYTGPCKLILPCVDNELVQFPLRMRDWLKNVLLQLYEHDSSKPGFLTSKQRFRVKKIFENERRLHAGDHPAELLAQDFEKNYNMYIYPVHWQFAQLDQHPSDRFLSHSELAPLRVPLVPMEHCTSRFFQECDADKDKQVSFKEWTSCFGIRADDMDANLLF